MFSPNPSRLVREALNKKLGRKVVCEVCGVSEPEWSDFGDLANNPHIKQGRHRGASLGDLRDATNEELKQARTFSRKLILGYLEYLDGQ